ncbi:hypothetical protein RR48_15491 [Papilio machaon]|uniref:Uncharacterized protein n=1 Tax=Papilio machaon TaxID=76193 RepID=A0A194QWL3_PAPMA|nr:hypothetical protein RR48_15491 [Papilio machaon]
MEEHMRNEAGNVSKMWRGGAWQAVVLSAHTMEHKAPTDRDRQQVANR